MTKRLAMGSLLDSLIKSQIGLGHSLHGIAFLNHLLSLADDLPVGFRGPGCLIEDLSQVPDDGFPAAGVQQEAVVSRADIASHPPFFRTQGQEAFIHGFQNGDAEFLFPAGAEIEVREGSGLPLPEAAFQASDCGIVLGRKMEEAARKIRAPVQILAEEAGHGLLFRAGMLPVSPDEDQLEEALRAAREGRVEVLLLEEGRAYPEGEEALDELVRLVLGKQGEVFFLPGAELEMKAGLAAIFRF